MRRAVPIIAVFALALSATAACGSSDSSGGQSSYNLKLAVFQPKTSIQPQTLQWMIDQISKRTNGKVKITPYWGASLVKAPDSFTAVSSGQVDMAQGTEAYAPAQLPLTQVWEIPFVSGNQAAVYAAMNKLYAQNKDLNNEWSKLGLHVLTFMPGSSNITGCKQPISGYASYKGRNIRAVGFVGQALEAAGAKPIAVSITSLYEDLQRGVVDCYSAMVMDVAGSLRLYSSGKYIVDDGIGQYSGTQLVIRKSVWDKMPSNLKDSINAVLNELPGQLTKTYADIDAKVCQTMKSSGAQLSIQPQSVTDAWRQQSQQGILSAWEKTAGSAAPPLYAQYTSLVRQYESQYSGYVSPFEACVHG